MPRIHYQDQSITLEDGQTVLDSLLAQGHDIANSCRAGVCQSCLLQATEGTVPSKAQAGLKPTQIAQGYFLACQCVPENDLVIHQPNQASLRQTATVTGLTRLSGQVMALTLQPEGDYAYYPGQYTTLWRDQKLGRSYSLASVPSLDEGLHFHVRQVPNGQFSGWVFDALQLGDRLAIQAATGDCIYLPEDPQRDLLLVGTATGLAPLYGILRDALQQGHQGDIHVFHGALDNAGLYLRDELAALAAAHAQVHYHPTVLQTSEQADPYVQRGQVDQLALALLPSLNDPTAYLCGAPEFVQSLRKRLFLAGMANKRIHADAFVPAAANQQTA